MEVTGRGESFLRFYVDIRDNEPEVFCFTFLFSLDDRSAEVVLKASTSKEYFSMRSMVKEVRFIGSKIRKETAMEFKTINDSVSIYWVTFDKYINHQK